MNTFTNDNTLSANINMTSSLNAVTSKRPFKKLIGLMTCLGLVFSGCSSAETVRITHHPIQDLVKQYASANPVHQTLTSDIQKPSITKRMRIMHIDLDYVYDANQAQQEKNIRALIERIRHIEANTIFLQAFADPDVYPNALRFISTCFA